MAKNKLLTIPIEADKRDRLNKHCADAGTTVAQLITKYIDTVLDNSIGCSISIDSSIPPIDIDSIVEKVIENLKSETVPIDRQFVSIEEFDKAMKHRDLEVEKLQRFVNYSEAKFHIEQSIDIPVDIEHVIYMPVEVRTLSDTKQYLQEKNDYNRSRSGGSKKITQTDMAVELNNYHYPHPQLKHWTRAEVGKICKIWKIITV